MVGIGARSQESDRSWHGLDSCGGVASASIAVMACMAVAAGLSSLQDMVMDPLGWALVLCFWDSYEAVVWSLSTMAG